MSFGFEKWSNNTMTDLNIRGVKWGFKKPILEADLNELQDLIGSQNRLTNKVTFKPNCYTSTGSRLYWTYNVGATVTTADLILDAEDTTDIVMFTFSGGVNYYYTPKFKGKQTLTTISLPNSATKGSVITLILKAKMAILSPDSSDINYSEDVRFARDTRIPNIIATHRVVTMSGFTGEFLENVSEPLEITVDNLKTQLVTSFNDDSYVGIILGSWEMTSDGWVNKFRLEREIVGVEEGVYSLLSDTVNTYGTYTSTPLIAGASCEVRLNFPLTSLRFGYYALFSDDGDLLVDGVPINQPIRVAPMLLEGSHIRLFDLRDISSEAMWGNFTGQSWESLLSQQWFTVTPVSPYSLRLKFSIEGYIEDVAYGKLKILK